MCFGNFITCSALPTFKEIVVYLEKRVIFVKVLLISCHIFKDNREVEHRVIIVLTKFHFNFGGMF